MAAVTETVTRNEMTDSDGSEAVTEVMTGGGFDVMDDGAECLHWQLLLQYHHAPLLLK